MKNFFLTMSPFLLLLASACTKTGGRATYQGVWDIQSVSYDSPTPEIKSGEPKSAVAEMVLTSLITSRQAGLEKITIKDNALWIHYADGSTDDTMRFQASKTNQSHYRLSNEKGEDIGEIDCPDAMTCKLHCYGWSFVLKDPAAKS